MGDNRLQNKTKSHTFFEKQDQITSMVNHRVSEMAKVRAKYAATKSVSVTVYFDAIRQGMYRQNQLWTAHLKYANIVPWAGLPGRFYGESISKRSSQCNGNADNASSS